MPAVTTVTPSPFVMRNATLVLGTSDFTAACSKAQLNPNSSTKTFRGLTPTANWAQQSNALWTLDLDFAQSLAVLDLLNYLFSNEATPAAFTLKPDNGIGAGWAGTVILTPATIGGQVDDYPTSSVSLPVQGKPVFTAGS